MNIYMKLEHFQDFTKNEEVLVHFILDNPDRFLRMSTKEICQECYVSTPTLYRLCQKLNLSGLAELKMLMSASLDDYLRNNDHFDFNYPIKPNNTHYEIMTRIKEDYARTIDATFDMVDLDVLRLSVGLLLRAKTIDIYTSASNIFMAQNFMFAMAEIGVSVNVPHEEYHQCITASASDESHVAIVITVAGRGMVFDKVVKILHKKNVPIILICSTAKVHLTQYATQVLHLSSFEDHDDKMCSYSTRLSILYLLDLLYSCYFKNNYQSNVNRRHEIYRGTAQYND